MKNEKNIQDKLKYFVHKIQLLFVLINIMVFFNN